MKKIIGLLACAIAMHSVAFSKGASLNDLVALSEKGSKFALYSLGVKYGNGDGVKQNSETALTYYTQAAIMNYAPAQNNLGWAYRQGNGIGKDYPSAVYWFRLSAIQGNALALQNLAEMYYSGEGVEANSKKAKQLYTLCATTEIDKDTARETGFNNAIHECRRELGKMLAVESPDGQKALRTAALWLTKSVSVQGDINLDSEIGVRARRSHQETTELLQLIWKKLEPDSVVWVNDVVEKWDAFRRMLHDRTSFPLTVIDEGDARIQPAFMLLPIKVTRLQR